MLWPGILSSPILYCIKNSQTDQAGFGVSYVALKETLSVFRSNVSASRFFAHWLYSKCNSHNWLYSFISLNADFCLKHVGHDAEHCVFNKAYFVTCMCCILCLKAIIVRTYSNNTHVWSTCVNALISSCHSYGLFLNLAPSWPSLVHTSHYLMRFALSVSSNWLSVF